jgi:hypothetical protein
MDNNFHLGHRIQDQIDAHLEEKEYKLAVMLALKYVDYD